MPPFRHLARRPRRAILAGIAATAALALSACAGGTSADPSASADADGIVVAAVGVPVSWAHDSGVITPGKYDYLTLSQGFLVKNPYIESDDGVTGLQDVTSFEGDLAESYDVSEDGLTYTFHLREDAVSAAGNPLTADDVVWTYERKFATPTSSVQFVNRPILTDPATQITKIDDHTVSFTVENAGYGFTLLSLLANSTGAIFDSTLLKEHATDDDPYAVSWSDTNWDSNYGFGPYMVDSVSGDTEWTMVANPNWYGDTAIDEITFKVIADPATRAQALANGEVQAAMALRSVDSADLLGNDAVVVPSGTWSSNLLIAPLVTNKAPFDDVLVRQAFQYAIPYEQIVENVYDGRATEANGMLDPSLPGYTDEGLVDYTYDPEMAADLLAEAGFADGVEFTLTYASGSPDVSDAAIQIQSAAAEAGFTVTLDEQPAAAFATGRAEGDYQAILQRDAALVQAPSYEMLLFTGEGATTNYSKWENPDYYAAVNDAIDAGDPATEEGGLAWNAAEQILMDDAAIAFIARPMANWAVASSLSDAAFRTDSTIDWAAVTPE
ncbi:ABC transporter substrate-binding protein [Microbacterium excoecariae]|uniref:ABC transporter substrate-binding protein n=1 Tax=Microbacterium excoecariae TaxID=2715210 RepID=UPI00140CB90B|nr:ABC transporter substrate-binding protein [Microbacterium excoecariae]NHI17688.1 ABC transporter substrate-binding protein [Microbacterium excoecariae]